MSESVFGEELEAVTRNKKRSYIPLDGRYRKSMKIALFFFFLNLKEAFLETSLQSYSQSFVVFLPKNAV